MLPTNAAEIPNATRMLSERILFCSAVEESADVYHDSDLRISMDG